MCDVHFISIAIICRNTNTIVYTNVEKLSTLGIVNQFIVFSLVDTVK